jgi:hypothetical protein
MTHYKNTNESENINENPNENIVQIDVPDRLNYCINRIVECSTFHSREDLIKRAITDYLEGYYDYLHERNAVTCEEFCELSVTDPRFSFEEGKVKWQ